MRRPKTIYKPKPEEVTAVLQEVFYEIKVLLWATELTYANKSEIAPLLESRLLHTRNLIDFLEHKAERRKEDDVLAEDYGFRLPQHIGISEGYRRRLNKSLSHITYTRVALRARREMKWPIKDTLLPLLDPCEAFLQHLIDSFLQEGDAEAKQEASRCIEYIESLKHIINTRPQPRHPK